MKSSVGNMTAGHKVAYGKQAVAIIAGTAFKRPVGNSALGFLERNFRPGDRDRVVCHCVKTV